MQLNTCIQYTWAEGEGQGLKKVKVFKSWSEQAGLNFVCYQFELASLVSAFQLWYKIVIGFIYLIFYNTIYT